MKRAIYSVTVLVLLIGPASAQVLREVRGRVLNEKDEPALNVDVTYYWSANGSYWDKDGKLVDFSNEATRNELFGPGRLGKMEPGVPEVVKSDVDGTFVIKIADFYHTLLAMDATRTRGGLGVISKSDPSSPVEIRLGPLVQVQGSFEGPGKGMRPPWTHVYWQVPNDRTRPLDITRIVGCSSNDARFLVSLPPGRYVIDAYNEAVDARLSGKEIDLSGDSGEVDLGVVVLPPSRSVIVQRRESQARGAFGDFTKHYGRKPPAWYVSDARGVSKDVQISDFKGKWVVLEFWGLSCTPCLKETIPELMRFYEEHSQQRDRFEILSLCLDPEGEFKSLADVDRALVPIVEHVWGGKTMPFPILLDNTFNTWESFGLPGLGALVLIDPQGNLVKGGLDLLKRKLAE